MNKTKMKLAVVGGAMGLIVLALGFLTWRAYTEKVSAIEGDENGEAEGLDAVVAEAEKLSKGAVYPCAESEKLINSNRTEIVDWTADARNLAKRGDRFYKPESPVAFKAFIVADAKRLIALPGAVKGQLAQPDFAFGPFKEYIVEGKMPAPDQVAELMRRWDDVATVVELLSTNGVAELLDVAFKNGLASAETADRKGKDAKKKRKPAAKDKTASDVVPKPQTYDITFSAKPANFVSVLNALAVVERFVVVDGFSFARPKDTIVEALNADEREAAAKKAASGRRGRHRGAAAEAEKEEDDDGKAKNKDLVTDPQIDAPLTVTLTVSVYDFHTLEEGSEAVSAEQKGESK